jgi:hypothetical protein
MKKNYKTILSALLCASILTANSTVLAIDKMFDEKIESMSIYASENTSSGLIYETNGEEITITGYSGTEKNVIIPSAIDGKSVTKIAYRSFADNDMIESIVLPDTIETLEWQAFSGCSSLKEFTVPVKVKRLSPNLFSNCTSLEKITLNEGLTDISAQVFENCVSLKEIFLPESLESIEAYAFEGCTGIKEISIYKNVNSISSEGNPFYLCTSLERINVDIENEYCHSTGDCLIKTGTKELVSGCNNSQIPTDGSVERIGARAFYGMNGLKEINISVSIKKILNDAFSGCGSVETIIVDETNEKYLANGNCLIEKETKRLLKGANGSMIPDDGSVTIIESGAFENCQGIKNIIIPASIEKIYGKAFSGCKDIETITVAEDNASFKSVDNCLIRKKSGSIILGCKNSVIPCDQTISSIASYAFYNCEGLKEIVIPDNITSIGSYAFSNCTDLTKIILPATIDKLEVGIFEGCISLENIDVPSGVTDIMYNAFKDCYMLKTVSLPDGLDIISSGAMMLGAFENCMSIESIRLPKSLRHIGVRSFKGCSNLKEVIINGTQLNTIDRSAFSGCDSLQDVYYPIGRGAWEQIRIFENNDALNNCNIHYLCGMKQYDDVDMIAVSFFGSAVENYKVIENNSTVFSANGSEKQNGNFSTGDKLTVGGMTYDVAVKGDLDGSGNIDATDIIILKRDLLNINKLSGVNKIAADIDEDEEISATDYISLKRHILGISDINDFSNK